MLPAIGTEVDPDAIIEHIVNDLTVALAALPGLTEGPVWLGMTAGQDSRAILAIAASAGVPVRPFTRLTPRMSVGDRVLPPRLALKAGYQHVTVRDAPTPVARAAMFRDHSAGSVADGDALPFLSGVRDSLSGILVGGHGFAVATGHANWRSLPDSVPSPEAAARQFLRHIGEPAEAEAAPGLVAWFEWAARTPGGTLHWRDRLYLEQRHAGWLAAKEQVFEMQDVVRFPLLNCAALTAQFLLLPQAWRAAGGIQRAIINRCQPALANEPANPPDAAFLTSHPLAVLRRTSHRVAAKIARRLERMRGSPGRRRH